MQFERGQRVALVHTTDPHTELRPGDQGTVRRHDADQRRVDVAWDSGSTLSMLLDEGDDITPIPTDGPDNPTDPATPATTEKTGWTDPLDAVRAAGTADGTSAAQWWLQDTIGGRASGDTTAAARRILNGIDDEDPAVLDTLPTADAGWPGNTATRYYHIAEDGHATELTAEQSRQAKDAYRDGYATAVTDTVAAACRRQLHPTGDDRDLSHLHPDNITFGSVGVFSGDWNDASADIGFPLTAGYVGTLVDRWNGWAVFTSTRTVAEAIVADQQQVRDAYRADLARGGVPEQELDRQTDEAYSRMWWDGDVIVVDSTALHDDPEAFERIEPDEDGRYVVMGRSWCWEAVDPYDCARIVGELPEPGASQEWILLTHAPYTKLPPAPCTVTNLIASRSGWAYSGELRYAGEWIATVSDIDAPATTTVGTVPAARLTTVMAGRFDAQAWQAHVAAARRCGEPMTEAAVLDALALETLFAHAIDEADAARAALVRLVDDAGGIRAVVRVSPAPLTAEAFADLRQRLLATHPDRQGVAWQYWNGRGWRHLTTAAADQPPPAPDGGTTPTG